MKYKPIHHKNRANPKLDCWGWVTGGDFVSEYNLPWQVYVFLQGQDYQLSGYYNHKVYPTERDAMEAFDSARYTLWVGFKGLYDTGYYDHIKGQL